MFYFHNCKQKAVYYLMFKIIALSLLSVATLFQLFVYLKGYLARKRPIPEEVNDVYDSNEFAKWKAYSASQMKAKIVFTIIEFVFSFVFIITNAYALITAGISNIYLSTLVVLGIYVGFSYIVSVISDFVMKIKIDGKYGFNKSTGKTFVGDCVRKLILMAVLFVGFTFLFIAIYEAMKDFILLLFSGLLIAFLFLVKILFPLLSKTANRFKSLEEGELRTRLTDMLTKNGYIVRDIKVMDASRRTTKSNAYFTGFSSTKTIVLYDNMLKVMSDDEIVAIFAHEMAHGLHKDSFKKSFFAYAMIVVLVVLTWLLVKFPEMYNDFGFSNVNYGFALVLLFDCVVPLIFRFLQIPSLIISRNCEYKADEFAAKEGYGEQLISSLKKLYKEDLGDVNPDPIVIALTYSHPTLAQRIRNIRKVENIK